jgi:hypothetical protein
MIRWVGFFVQEGDNKLFDPSKDDYTMFDLYFEGETLLTDVDEQISDYVEILRGCGFILVLEYLENE